MLSNDDHPQWRGLEPLEPRVLLSATMDFAPADELLSADEQADTAVIREVLAAEVEPEDGGIAGFDPADVNEDGIVDRGDLDLVIENWGCEDEGCVGDTNGDGVVDVRDMTAVILNWTFEVPSESGGGAQQAQAGLESEPRGAADPVEAVEAGPSIAVSPVTDPQDQGQWSENLAGVRSLAGSESTVSGALGLVHQRPEARSIEPAGSTVRATGTPLREASSIRSGAAVGDAVRAEATGSDAAPASITDAKSDSSDRGARVSMATDADAEPADDRAAAEAGPAPVEVAGERGGAWLKKQAAFDLAAASDAASVGRAAAGGGL